MLHLGYICVTLRLPDSPYGNKAEGHTIGVGGVCSAFECDVRARLYNTPLRRGWSISAVPSERLPLRKYAEGLEGLGYDSVASLDDLLTSGWPAQENQAIQMTPHLLLF